MEIRTLDEVRAGRVTLTVTVDVAQSTDPGTLGRLAGQEDRIADLEAEADRYRRELGKVNEVWAEKVAELERQVREYDVDRRTERDRADRVTAELARRTEERDGREAARAELERRLADAEGKLFRIQRSAWNGKLDRPVEHRGDPAAIAVDEVGEMVSVLAYVRATVGQPE